jgi:hypothetical protein
MTSSTRDRNAIRDQQNNNVHARELQNTRERILQSDHNKLCQLCSHSLSLKSFTLHAIGITNRQTICHSRRSQNSNVRRQRANSRTRANSIIVRPAGRQYAAPQAAIYASKTRISSPARRPVSFGSPNISTSTLKRALHASIPPKSQTLQAFGFPYSSATIFTPSTRKPSAPCLNEYSIRLHYDTRTRITTHLQLTKLSVLDLSIIQRLSLSSTSGAKLIKPVPQAQSYAISTYLPASGSQNFS